MLLQIVGRKKSKIQSKKNGKSYTIINTHEKDPDWMGVNSTTQFLDDDTMGRISVETDSGEIYLPDGKKYYFDADYNRYGRIVGGRIYND